MKTRLLILIPSIFSVLACAADATDKTVPARAIFLVSGLECGSCVYAVQYSLSQTPGIADAEVVQQLDSFTKVSFDPKVISEHQIAQAVRETAPLHGTPYIASMKLRIPAYSQEGRAAHVKSIFARWKKWVELEVWDEREGVLVINFLPLEQDAKASKSRGWSLADLTEALQHPASKGLGLTFEFVDP